MDIKEVLHMKKPMDILLDSKFRGSNKQVTGGTFGSKNTLVFFTGKLKTGINMDWETHLEQSDYRIKINEEEGNGKIQLNLHQSKEIAHMFQDNSLVKTAPLTLEASNEYFLDITPHVTITTDAFKNLNFKQRRCKLKDEVEKDSIFKVYTRKNCKYECHIKEAENICKCIPWDYMHNTLAEECDIFGRTCFYNTMEKLTMSNEENICNQCIQECDFTKFEIITSKEIINSFQKYEYIQSQRICKGQKAFCDFILSGNGTNLIDNGLKNAYNTLKMKSFDAFRLKGDPRLREGTQGHTQGGPNRQTHGI